MHIVSVHENKKSYMCSICNFISSKKAGFKTHMESVHENKSSGMNSPTIVLHLENVWMFPFVE